MRVLFLFLGLALGVSLGYIHEVPSMIITSIIAVIVLSLSLVQKEAKGYAISLILGVGIGLLGHIPHSEGYETIKGIVVKISDNYVILWRPFFRSYVYQEGHSYQVGDILEASGYCKTIASTRYEGRFCFEDYLRRYGVNYEISAARINPIFSFPIRFRNLEKNFLSNFNGETASLLDSILFGHSSRGDEVIGIASSMNVLFVISASGMFLQRVLGLARGFCLRLGMSDKTAEKVEAIAGFFFFPLCFRKIGITRVILSKGIRYWNRYHAKTPLTPLGVSGLSGIIQILVFPYSVFQTGFLLGYGVSFAMSFYGHRLNQIKRKTARRLLTICFISLFMIPTAIQYGGKLHLFSPILTLLITPLACLFAFFGFFGFLIIPIPPFMNFLGSLLGNWIRFLAPLDLAFALPKWSIWMNSVYYGLFVLSLLWSEQGFVELKNIVTLGSIAVYSLSFLPIAPMFSMQVSFINVGQGDSILIRDRSTVVLLDTGGNISFDMAEEVLIPYLRKQRIYHIDCLIASHHDFDHIGAKDSLEANFDVRDFVDSKDRFPLTVGNITFQNWNIYPAQEENDASLVIQTEFMGKKWVFTGDAPTEIEKRILRDGIDVDCDILKIGHHGSITSTSTEWLLATSPEEAVISVGTGNSYGHPNEEVLLRLKGLGIRIRRTDQEGTITYAKATLPWV